MANLFTKYHVSDELAFPLLLRGLEKTENWTKLSRSDLTEREITEPKIDKPEVCSSIITILSYFVYSTQLVRYPKEKKITVYFYNFCRIYLVKHWMTRLNIWMPLNQHIIYIQ